MADMTFPKMELSRRYARPEYYEPYEPELKREPVSMDLKVPVPDLDALQPYYIPYDHYICVYRDWNGKIQFATSDSMRTRYEEIMGPIAVKNFQTVIHENVTNGEGVIKAGKRIASRIEDAPDVKRSRATKNDEDEDEEPSQSPEAQNESSEPSPPRATSWFPLAVGDEVEMNAYFTRSLNCLQQQNCRYIAKAIIKVIEPRKQVTFPYNGGKNDKGIPTKDPESSKPPWWPSGVRHKEPDHLMKSDRVALLLHILRGKQFRQREKDRIDAEELRSCIGEVRRTKIKAPEHRQILDELLDVVEFQERYWRDEVGPEAKVYVTDRRSYTKKSRKSKRGSTESDDEDEMSDGMEERAETTPIAKQQYIPGADILSPMSCDGSYTSSDSGDYSHQYPDTTMSSYDPQATTHQAFTNPFARDSNSGSLSRDDSPMSSLSPVASHPTTASYIPRTEYTQVSQAPRTLPAGLHYSAPGSAPVTWAPRANSLSMYHSPPPWPYTSGQMQNHMNPPTHTDDLDRKQQNMMSSPPFYDQVRQLHQPHQQQQQQQQQQTRHDQNHNQNHGQNHSQDHSQDHNQDRFPQRRVMPVHHMLSNVRDNRISEPGAGHAFRTGSLSHPHLMQGADYPMEDHHY